MPRTKNNPAHEGPGVLCSAYVARYVRSTRARNTLAYFALVFGFSVALVSHQVADHSPKVIRDSAGSTHSPRRLADSCSSTQWSASRFRSKCRACSPPAPSR